MVRQLPQRWDNHIGALNEGTASEGEEADLTIANMRFKKDKLSLDGVAAEDEDDDVPLTSIAQKAVPKNAGVKLSKNGAAEKSPMGGIASEDVENFPLGIASEDVHKLVTRGIASVEELATEGFASEDADTFFPVKGIAAKNTEESPVEGIAAEDTDNFADSFPIEAIDTEYAMDLPAITGMVDLAEDEDDSDGAVKTPVGKGHSKGSKNFPGAENLPVARRFPAATQDSVRAPFPSANVARKESYGTKSFTVTRQIPAAKQNDDAKKRDLALAGYVSDSDDDSEKTHPIRKEDCDDNVPTIAAPTPKRRLDKNWVSSWSAKPLSLPSKIETNQTKGMIASSSSTAKRIRVDPIDSSSNEKITGGGEVVAEILGRKVALRPVTIKSSGVSKQMEEKEDNDESGGGWKKEDKWKDNEWKKDEWKKDDKWKKDEEWKKKDDKNGWNDWKKDDNWKRKTDGEEGDKWKNGWNNSGWKDWKRKDDWEWDDKTSAWKKKDETEEKKDAPQKDDPVSDPLPKSSSQVKPSVAPPRANPVKPLPPGFPTSISEWERPEIQRKMFPNLPVLPRGWIRCCTKSRPHQMYYFKKSSGRTTFEMADVLKSRAA